MLVGALGTEKASAVNTPLVGLKPQVMPAPVMLLKLPVNAVAGKIWKLSPGASDPLRFVTVRMPPYAMLVGPTTVSLVSEVLFTSTNTLPDRVRLVLIVSEPME